MRWGDEGRTCAHRQRQRVATGGSSAEVARMLADGTIAARIRTRVDLDGAGQMFEKLRNGGLRGKAVIRL